MYGIDLLDLWRGTMTPRKAATLAAALPAGAAVGRSVGSAAAWTEEGHQLANITDLLAGANWQRGDGKHPQPKPMMRPGDAGRANVKTGKTASQAERFRARQAQREVVADGG